MLRKIFMALLIAAASFNFATTTDAAEMENYHCRNYDNGCYDYYDNHHGDYDGGYYHGRGCHR